MPTSQKENKQVGDKLSNIAKQVLENSVIEKDSPTEPESVLDTPTDQQEGSQTGGKLNHVLDQLREAAPEEVLPMDTDGVIVPTEDGSLLVPADGYDVRHDGSSVPCRRFQGRRISV